MRKKKKLKYSYEIHPGIYQIPLSIPGNKPGPVNAYLFSGENTSLLDTGTSRTVKHLKKALKEHNINFSDINQVILTHAHIDHFGAAKFIVNESKGKTKVAVHREGKIIVEGGTDVPNKIGNNFIKLMGVPFAMHQTMKILFRTFNFFTKKCKIDILLKDSDEVHLGNYKGKVIETPGHSKDSICIYIKKEKILFSGDHILGHITPNAFVMLDTQKSLPVRSSQEEFYNSITKIEKLTPSTVYTGHGKKITNLKKIIKSYRKSFDERQDLILEILEDGEQNTYQIARKLFPEVDTSRLPLEIFCAISEVYSHLHVLQSKDSVTMGIKNKILLAKKSI